MLGKSQNPKKKKGLLRIQIQGLIPVLKNVQKFQDQEQKTRGKGKTRVSRTWNIKVIFF
jgi:hypothetical protein